MLKICKDCIGCGVLSIIIFAFCHCPVWLRHQVVDLSHTKSVFYMKRTSFLLNISKFYSDDDMMKSASLHVLMASLSIFLFVLFSNL